MNFERRVQKWDCSHKRQNWVGCSKKFQMAQVEGVDVLCVGDVPGDIEKKHSCVWITSKKT